MIIVFPFCFDMNFPHTYKVDVLNYHAKNPERIILKSILRNVIDFSMCFYFGGRTYAKVGGGGGMVISMCCMMFSVIYSTCFT